MSSHVSVRPRPDRIGSRLFVAIAAAAAVMVGATGASAQAQYPDRPITFVVGFPPGGYADTASRFIAGKLGKILGKDVVVENRPGAGSLVAVTAVSQAKPDGYTLLNADGGTWNSYPYLNKELGYKPDTAFIRIHGLTRSPQLISVPANSPFMTLDDMIAYARANPGKLKFGAVGTGSLAHLAGELLAREAKVKFLYVPYKGGGEVNTDLLGGRLEMSVAVPLGVQGLVNDGKLRPVFVTGSKRLPAFPNVPTAAELGYPAVDLDIVSILAVPAGTPKDVTDRLTAAMKQTMADPETVKFLEERGLMANTMVGDAITQYIDTSKVQVKTLIDSLGLTPQ